SSTGPSHGGRVRQTEPPRPDPGAIGAPAPGVFFPAAPSIPSSTWRSLMTVFHSVPKWFPCRGRPAAPGRKPSRPRPALEALGERIVPAAFHVPTLADSGDGSLRAAVAQANAHAGADTIVFDDGLSGTIALTGGELDITDDLKVNGPGADKLT